MKRLWVVALVLIITPFSVFGSDDPLIDIYDYWLNYQGRRIAHIVEKEPKLKEAADLMMELFVLTIEQQKIRASMVQNTHGVKGVIVTVGLGFPVVDLSEEENAKVLKSDEWVECAKRIETVLSLIDMLENDYERICNTLRDLENEANVNEYVEFIKKRGEALMERYEIGSFDD